MNVFEALANWWAENPDENQSNYNERTNQVSFHTWSRLKGEGKTSLSWDDWVAKQMETRDTHNGEHKSSPRKFKDIPSDYNDHY